MKKIEEVRNFFQNDVYATGTTGIVIEKAEPGYAKVSLVPGPQHRNAAGQIMGAVFYTMADFAFAVANNYEFDGPLTVTLSSQINFLSTFRGEKLFAETRILKQGHKTSFYEILITDDVGTMIATVSSNGYRISPVNK